MANLILKLGDIDRKIDKQEVVRIANENGQVVILTARNTTC